MIALFSTMNPMMVWLIIGALLILFEIILPGVYLFWIGVAALIVGFILNFLPLSLTIQILLFAIFCIVTVLIGVKTYKGKDRDITTPHLNQARGAEYIGKVFTLTQDVINNEGRLPIGDSVWGIHGEDLPAGTKIRITKANGNTLIYERSE